MTEHLLPFLLEPLYINLQNRAQFIGSYTLFFIIFYWFIPAVFSHTSQIHGEFKILGKEQIRQKLIAFEGEAKSSKIRSIDDEMVVEMHIYGDRQNG